MLRFLFLFLVSGFRDQVMALEKIQKRNLATVSSVQPLELIADHHDILLRNLPHLLELVNREF